MADFNFTPAKSNIAAQPGMSLGEMMNMATQAQALQQAQQLNPLQLQAAQQTVEQARQIALRIQNFLSLTDDTEKLIASVVPNYGSFYWDAASRASGKEVFGI
jgi:uncharacterized membrane protein